MGNDYKAYTERLIKALKKNKLSHSILGAVDGENLYQFTVNPRIKRRIGIVGGIHGDEIGGPHGITYWLENYDLPNNIGIDVLPLVNPYGYINHQRNNKHYDMNRQWSSIDNLQHENKLIYDYLKDKDYELIFTVHEDPEQKDGFYLYCCDRHRVVLWKECVKLAEKYFKIYSKDSVWGDPIVDGIGWHDSLKQNKDSKCIENWFFNEKNIPYLTTEPSDVDSLKDRERFFAELIDLVCRKY
jgi:hypothetical protein